MSGGVEASCANEGGPFWSVWARGAAVEHVAGNVGDLVAEGLEEELAGAAAESSC